MTYTLKQKDQSGMASFLIITIIVTLMALVSVGFSHLSSRELRQSLDRELSDQAYYAAESGLNDAKNYLQVNQNATNASCNAPGANNFVSNGDISANGAASSGVAKYTCVLINSTPTSIPFTITPNNPKSFEVSSTSLPNFFSNFFFSWQNSQGNDGPLGSFPALPQESSATNTTGLLGVTIYPAANGDNMNSLASSSKHFFLYPNGGDGSIGSADFASGGFMQGNCKAGTTQPAYCNGEVKNLPNASTFYVSLSAYYQPLLVTFRAQILGGNSMVGIPGVEASVDVTGSGSDVLRRLQSYVPLNVNNSIPGYGIQSMQSICKLFRVNIAQPGKYDTSGLDSAATNPDGSCFAPNGNTNDAINNVGQGPPL